MSLRHKLFFFLTALIFHSINCDTNKEENPETIYLPYSESEDVDFTIARSGFGCYQWSCENEDVIELIPIYNNYELQCGSKLEIKIIPKTGNPKGPVKLTISADNVDISQDTAVEHVEYTVVVVPVARLEVISEKTSIKPEDGPVMFGVGAYDADNNEFDTLDGVTLSWFIGAKRDIAKFHGTATGPLIHIEAIGGGKGSVICVISDEFYNNLEPAMMEVTVNSQLSLHPDGIYLLTGGEANLTLFEKIGSKDDFVMKSIPWEETDYTVVSRDDTIVKVDMKRKVVIGGVPDDETALLIKDGEGNIIKGVPIRTARPHKMEIRSHPHPESRQLIVGQQYNITTHIYDKEEHEIYPSQNIFMKTTFGKQFAVDRITVNGDLAEVVPEYVGIAKIRASLRATLTPEDDEIEIEPHVKVTTDFEIYETPMMNPTKTILPWEPGQESKYELNYKVTGGGKVYKYQVEPDTLATVDSEGKVTVVSGPGSVTVTAGMTQSMHNNATAKVHLTTPTRLELIEYGREWTFNQSVNIPVAIFTMDPDTNEEILYTDCSDVNFEVTLSNNKDFTALNKSKRGDNYPPGACGMVHITGTEPGANTKVTVSYKIPGSEEEIKDSTNIVVFKNLEWVVPAPPKGANHLPQVVLPVGSSRDVLVEHGPVAWIGKPSHYFRDALSIDEDVARIRLLDDPAPPHHVAVVTCFKLGETLIEIGAGNKPSSTNKKPNIQRKQIKIICSEPAKISKIEIEHTNVNNIQVKQPIVNPKTNRIMTYSYRDFTIVTTVKDKEGRTFDNTTSLEFRVSLSNKEMALVGTGLKHPYTFTTGVSMNFRNPLRETIKIHPHGVAGDLDIQVAVTGYRRDVLMSVGAPIPTVDIPPAPEPFKEDEDEDYDYDDDGNFIVTNTNTGIADEISLTLATDPDIDAIYDAKFKRN